MNNFGKHLCEELKKYDDVIIYGYADIGVMVLDYIIELETSIKIANYSGRVKYFASSETKRTSNRLEKKGIRIKSIYELQEYADDALVIIATQEMHHSAIEKVLDELEFKNRLFVKHEDYCELREAVENHVTIVNNNIQNYHINHQIKLDRLKRKVEKGQKVKVFFMTHDSSVFGCASVYWSMVKDELFEPYIYVVSRRDVGYIAFMDDVDKDVRYFMERGYRVIKGYDENGNPKDLHEFRPDILFYDIPKLYGAAGTAYNRLEQLNWEYLTCYVPYGLMMVDSFYYHYHTKCIRETWKFFIDTSADFKRVLADSDFNGFNTVMGGYPKFDEYNKSLSDLPDKINNGKPIVIYAPHHSLFASNNFATFDLYKDFMMELVINNPDINFVIKPHPLLPYQINARAQEGKINFTRKDYEDYLQKWNSLDNGYVADEGDYIKYFKKCQCMITDCGSFIGEFFPSLKPCIYLFNPRKKRQADVYTPLAKNILDTYYIARNKDELVENINEVIINGNDDKLEKRKKLLSAEFGDIGHSGEKICKYLHNIIEE